MRSLSSDRAVSINTGTGSAARVRSSRQIDNPSSPGSITSSTIRSTGAVAITERICRASAAVLTRNPLLARYSPTRLRISRSSSTTRT